MLLQRSNGAYGPLNPIGGCMKLRQTIASRIFLLKVGSNFFSMLSIIGVKNSNAPIGQSQEKYPLHCFYSL